MSSARRELEEIAEEIANSVTHGVGLGLSLAGAIVLVLLAADREDAAQRIGLLVYGTSLVTLYAASTLYHSVNHARLKPLLRIVDHAAIYLLIAGTYTPFLLVHLRESAWGRAFLVTVWALTLLGVLYKVFFMHRFPRLSTATYLGMGWMALLVAPPMSEAVPLDALALLALGGLLYTAGVWFYARDDKPYRHAIWHLFVLGGSICHYLAVLLSIALPAGSA